MLQPNFTPFPAINTERLVLRELTPADVNEMFFLRSDERVMTYLDKAPEKSTEETFAIIKTITDNSQNNNAIFWVITLKDDNKMIGSICYWRIEKAHYRAEIGYVLHPSQHRKGIMDEAMKAVLQYGFETMKLHSVEANINPANTESMKLLEKNGFVKEAYFKENYYYDGKFLDSVIYSLITPF